MARMVPYWTVIGVRHRHSDEVAIVASVAGVAVSQLALGGGTATWKPFVRVVQAASDSAAREAVVLGDLWTGEQDDQAAVPSAATPESCAQCDTSGRFYPLYQALGHDGLGHRTANALIRANVDTVDRLRLFSDDELLGIKQIGWLSLERIRQAVAC